MADRDEFDDAALDSELHQLIDTEGRYLGEQRAVVPPGGPAPEMRLKACPYAGSRHHHARPMNVSALQQLTAHWSSVLDGMAVLRARVVAPGATDVALDDVYRVVRTATLLPAYLTRRRHAPLGSGAIEAGIATLYKVAVGYVGLVQRMGFDLVLGTGDDLPTASVDEIVAEAEENGDFIGPNQVCAGPVNMVKDVLEVIATGARQVEASPWPGVDPVELDRAFAYADRVMQLELTKTLLGIEIWQLGSRVRAQLGEPAPPDGPKPHMSVTWDLDEYSEEEREELEPVLRRRIASYVRAAVARRGPTPPSAEAFFRAFEAATDTTFEPSDAGPAGQDLARYAAVERAALVALTDLRDLARAALGAESGRPLGEADVTRVFGPTPRDIATAAAGRRPTVSGA